MVEDYLVFNPDLQLACIDKPEDKHISFVFENMAPSKMSFVI